MSTQGEFYEVVVDFSVQEQDSPIVLKGEIVKVIKKESDCFIIEKDGIIIKIPSQYLHLCSSESSDNKKNEQEKDNQINIVEFEKPQLQDFEIVKKLFGGAMGKTFLVRHKASGLMYVMKRVDYFDENDKKNVDFQIEQMHNLTSSYTVRLICTFTDQTDMFIITEYYSRGNLRKVISELQKLPEEERINRVWELFAQIILALDFMHSKGVLHRDIKPENIFIMEDGSARLGDFGLVKEMNEICFGFVEETKIYLSPEFLIMEKMYFSSDIFAVGICIFELITGQHPFAADSEQEMINKIKNGDLSQLLEYIPNEMKILLLMMLNPV
ncbi:MAG: putative Serine/threonine-protein kinase Nek6 [Streblomastix strix]|uniref:non-specific serine/threonine protein kinase n=1 Tax=Streblomastix strix TaxID=222440 RepID=A0A5J4VT59_9EUKA|nr:MAG: putative Serine/threonine-protein kinase Nek6 [Streblomastix strix]